MYFSSRCGSLGNHYGSNDDEESKMYKWRPTWEKVALISCANIEDTYQPAQSDQSLRCPLKESVNIVQYIDEQLRS